MTTVIVEQPDDLPVVGVSEHNPYKHEDGLLHTEEPRAVYFGTTRMHVPSTTILRAWELEEHGRTIKFVAFFDATFAVINFLLVGYLPMLIAVFFNYLGYLGASRFNKKLLGSYCAFQIFNFSSKIAFIVMKVEPKTSPILGVSSVFNVLMAVMTFKFMRMIPT